MDKQNLRKDSYDSAAAADYYPQYGEKIDIFSREDVIRVTRLLMEALEVAFFLSNIFLERYGLAKIFDIINQVMPTAYVYNTGYWVFYKREPDQCLCVCKRFGIRCPHKKSAGHFVDMEPIQENRENYFCTNFGGKLYPVDTKIMVTPVSSNTVNAYNIKIDLTVMQLLTQNDRFILCSDEKTNLVIETRFIITPESYPLERTVIQFNPHPLGLHVYSSYLQNMDRFHIFLNTFGWQIQVPRTYTIASIDLPRFTMTPNIPNIKFPPLNPNSVHFQLGNSTPFENLRRPDANSFIFSLRGGAVRYASQSSKAFLTQLGFGSFEQDNYGRKRVGTTENFRNFGMKTRNRRQQSLQQPPGYSPKEAASASFARGSPDIQEETNPYFVPLRRNSSCSDEAACEPAAVPNLFGPDYEVDFPSLRESCSPRRFNKNRKAGKNQFQPIVIYDSDETVSPELLVEDHSEAAAITKGGGEEDSSVVVIEDASDDDMFVSEQSNAVSQGEQNITFGEGDGAGLGDHQYDVSAAKPLATEDDQCDVRSSLSPPPFGPLPEHS